MKTLRLAAAMAITIMFGTACGGAPQGSMPSASVGSPAESHASSQSVGGPSPVAAPLPDGIWEAELTAEDLEAAGAADAGEPGTYRLTVDGSRVRVALEGAWECDGDTRVQADGVRISWHPAMNCGGFDIVTWTVDDEGLHLQLVDTSGYPEGTIAVFETEPYQPTGGEAELSWSEAWTTCTNSNGGACLDALEAGTHETSVFETPFSYTVDDGWSNFEDLPGNVLLVPPTGSLGGVDAGTSDFISVLDGVAAQAAGCVEGPAADVAQTPEAMMSSFAGRADLDVTDPVPVIVGGLDGLVADISLAESHTELCPQLPSEFGPFAFLIVGVGPADLNHGVFGELTIRLYLLNAPGGEVLAIEVDDVPGGTPMNELDAVARSIEFATSP